MSNASTNPFASVFQWASILFSSNTIPYFLHWNQNQLKPKTEIVFDFHGKQRKNSISPSFGCCTTYLFIFPRLHSVSTLYLILYIHNTRCVCLMFSDEDSSHSIVECETELWLSICTCDAHACSSEFFLPVENSICCTSSAFHICCITKSSSPYNLRRIKKNLIIVSSVLSIQYIDSKVTPYPALYSIINVACRKLQTVTCHLDENCSFCRWICSSIRFFSKAKQLRN